MTSLLSVAFLESRFEGARASLLAGKQGLSSRGGAGRDMPPKGKAKGKAKATPKPKVADGVAPKAKAKSRRAIAKSNPSTLGANNVFE